MGYGNPNFSLIGIWFGSVACVGMEGLVLSAPTVVLSTGLSKIFVQIFP